MLLAVTMRQLQGQDVTMSDYLPELAHEEQAAHSLTLLAAFEAMAATPPRER